MFDEVGPVAFSMMLKCDYFCAEVDKFIVQISAVDIGQGSFSAQKISTTSIYIDSFAVYTKIVHCYTLVFLFNGKCRGRGKGETIERNEN